jgi:hypothetical protein
MVAVTSWGSHTLPDDAYLPGVNFDTNHTYWGADVSLRLDNQDPVISQIFAGGVPVEPQNYL